ncbi:MAG: DUF4251 domain-containing protein [Sphingobacteriaceae bacterium]|nr:MAG: DUF4251 domain-containing protein [Sphingobacteriaceae bacterium]
MNAAYAQNAKADKKAAQEKQIKNKIDSANYTFKANYALPLRGGQVILTTNNYDLKVNKDTVTAYLPYYGRVYFSPPLNATDAGIKFTSTKFEYKVTAKKKGGWLIVINFKDTDRSTRMTLDVAVNGAATLSSISNNRDSITFYGELLNDNKK